MKVSAEIRRNREKWFRALESRRYRQGARGVLRDRDGGYCCLGVWLKCSRVKDSEWLRGILREDQRSRLGMSEGAMIDATRMNDNLKARWSFKEIAAHFRKRWNQPRGARSA